MASIALVAGAFAAGASVVYAAIVRGSKLLKRESYIRRYVFPASVMESVAKTYPHLDQKDLFLVARALRTYFLAHLKSHRAVVAMPSKAVDAMWHEFILDTKAYHAF